MFTDRESQKKEATWTKSSQEYVSTHTSTLPLVTLSLLLYNSLCILFDTESVSCTRVFVYIRT